MRPELILPIVHVNGTSKEELVDLRTDVEMALDAAHEALCRMAPNGREYEPDAGRMQKAEAQHRRRIDTLQGLIEEIRAEIVEIEGL